MNGNFLIQGGLAQTYEVHRFVFRLYKNENSITYGQYLKYKEADKKYWNYLFWKPNE
jgi:hypothetical protein